MVFTNQDYLPTVQELTVEELPVSAAPLRAAAHHLGKYCDYPSKEFMLCRKEEKDPRKCLTEGKEVTKCGLDFFRKLKGTCAESFTSYWQCIDHAGRDMRYSLCRKQQKKFDDCMLEFFNQERPGLGHFSKTRVHDSKKPKPERNIPLPEAVPEIPTRENSAVPPSMKYGSRQLWHSATD